MLVSCGPAILEVKRYALRETYFVFYFDEHQSRQVGGGGFGSSHWRTRSCAQIHAFDLTLYLWDVPPIYN